MVTEYGSADLRRKTDTLVIEALLKITDSRFQKALIRRAKKAGKLRADYRIPELYRNNYPESVIDLIGSYRSKGYFPVFPFGTDFTAEEQVIGKALKALKRKTASRRLLIAMLLKALFTRSIPEQQEPYLQRMGLWETRGFKGRLYRNLLANELRDSAGIGRAGSSSAAS